MVSGRDRTDRHFAQAGLKEFSQTVVGVVNEGTEHRSTSTGTTRQSCGIQRGPSYSALTTPA
jgi:hypothetical protein